MEQARVAGSWLMEHLLCINLLLSVVIVFFQRRDPKAVWTWLLLLYFVPVFGFFFYLIFAQDYHKSKMFRVKEVEDRLRFPMAGEERCGEIVQRKEGSSQAGREEEGAARTGEGYEDLVRYNLEQAGAVLTWNNRVEIFTDGDRKFADLRRELSRARHFIHIQYYIIKDDEVFASLFPILTDRAQQGVEVRILYDGMGGRFMPRKRWRQLEEAGIQVASFFPPFLGRLNLRVNYRNHRKIVVIDGRIGYVGGFNIGREYVGRSRRFGYWRDTHLKLTGDAVISLQIRFALDWNYAKGENLFLDAEYFRGHGYIEEEEKEKGEKAKEEEEKEEKEKEEKEKEEKEKGGREKDGERGCGEEKVKEKDRKKYEREDRKTNGKGKLEEGKSKDREDGEDREKDRNGDESGMAGSGGGSRAGARGIGIQVIASGPDSLHRQIRDNYLRLFHKARHHIYIQTPYFVPDDAVLSALKIAAASGIDVRLMIPCKPDHPFVYWATCSYMGELLQAGARCYAYQQGFLHAKAVMVDGMVSCCGTANMDIRSFELNFEVNAVLYDGETTGRMEEIFMEDLVYCREITREDYEGRGWLVRLKEQGCRLLSPLL